MQLTVKQAAETYGLARSTIHRAIRNGRLSASRQGRARVIDVAELVRVYGEPPGSAPETQHSGEAFVASELLQELRQLRQEVAALREALAEQRALPAPPSKGASIRAKLQEWLRRWTSR